MGAYWRQANVQAAYLNIKSFLKPQPTGPYVVPTGTGQVVTFFDQGTLTFIDRNNDASMDMATFAAPDQPLMVNYGTNTNFNQGWQVYNSNNVLPPPPAEKPDYF